MYTAIVKVWQHSGAKRVLVFDGTTRVRNHEHAEGFARGIMESVGAQSAHFRINAYPVGGKEEMHLTRYCND